MNTLLRSILLSFLLLVSRFLFSQSPQLVIPTGHSDNMGSMALSADGRHVLTGENKLVILWDATTGRQLRSFVSAPGYHQGLFMPDGKSMLVPDQATASFSIVDIASGAVKKRIQPPGHAHFRFTPDGKYLLGGGSDGNVQVYDWAAENIVKIYEQGDPAQGNLWTGFVALSPNGKLLAAGGQAGMVDIWQWSPSTDGGTVQVSQQIKGFNRSMSAGVFAPDNDRLVVADGEGKIVCWSFKANKTLWTKTLDNAGQLGFSPDGKKLRVSTFGEIHELDAATGAETGKLYEHRHYGFSQPRPDRLLVAAGNNDALLLSLPALDTLAHFRQKVDNGYDIAAFPGKNQVFVGGSIHATRVWDFDQGKMLRSLPATGLSLHAVSAQNRLLWSSADGIEYFDVTDPAKSKYGFDNKYSSWSMALSKDGNKAVLANYDGSVVVYDLAADREIARAKPFGEKAADAMAVSPDGKTVALTQLKSGLLKILNLADGREIKSASFENAGGVSWTRDGRIALGGVGNLWLLDGRTLAVQKNISFESYQPVGRFEWLPGGNRAICAVQDDENNLMLVDFDKSVVERMFTGHTEYPRRLAVLPDGRHFVSVSSDHTIRLWDIGLGHELCQLYTFLDSGEWVAVSPDGRFDGSQGGIEQLYYTKGNQVITLAALYEKFYTPNLIPRLLKGDIPATPGQQEDNVQRLKSPPTVRVNAPAAFKSTATGRYETAAAECTVTVEASCPDDGISEIRLYQNGKLVGGGARNLIVEDDLPTTKTQTFALTLAEGANSLRAVALNSQRTESAPGEITVDFRPAVNSQVVPGNNISLWLVVVGINQYKNPKYTLNYANADATAFKESLESHGQGIFGKTNSFFLQDAGATKTEITAVLEKVKTAAKPQDLLVFYYAGHGVMAGAEGKQEFFLVPHDVTQLYGNDEALAQKGLSSRELQAFSKEIKAQKQLFVLDACQSAGALNDAASRGAAEEKAIAQLARSTGTHWLTASGSEQFAGEFAQLGHGVYTYCLLEGLSGNADSGDGKITVKELDAYLQSQVPEVSQKYKGTPQYPASYGFGNDFPLGVVR